MNETKLKLARENLANAKASLAWEADKDQVRRRIAAIKDRIRQLEIEDKS